MARLNRFELKKIYLISKYTFKDLYKSRILVNCLFLGLALMIATFVASEFTYGTPIKVALDFGLGAMSISTVFITVFMGVSIISREIENRTVYSILSRNVSRAEFLLGKISGLTGILFINILILFALSISMFLYLGGTFDFMILLATIFIFIEAITTLLIVVFFSLITNSVLSVLFTVAIYFASYTIPRAIEFSQSAFPAVASFLKFVLFLFPNFEKANIKNHVLYNEFLSTEFILKNFTISSCYICALLLIIVVLFNKKNLN